MYIRKSTPDDLPEILSIYAHARAFMKAHGNPDQWGDIWPPEDLIRRDISEGTGRVCIGDDGRICAVFYYNFGDHIDPCYDRIYDGAWRNDSPYGVVHRIASAGTQKGAGSFCILWGYEQSGRHLRMDTHGDNKVMQACLAGLGFVRCGTVYVAEDNAPRIAYEKWEPAASSHNPQH